MKLCTRWLRFLTPTLALGLWIAAAEARPQETIPPLHYEDLSAPARAGVKSSVFSMAAGPDTVYFGGTFWSADSARWEAIQDSVWTFDSGVGSNFNHSDPAVDPFKDPSLHASMEGWTGIDRTYFDLPYFRRMDKNTYPGTGQNVCSITGNFIWWAGLLPDEARDLCYADGQGYGNNWNLCIEQTFTYDGAGTISFQYDYQNDTELDFDYTYVRVDTADTGSEVELAAYTGAVSGTGLHTLTPGSTLRTTSGPFKIRFCVVSDQSGSDEDGLYATKCGAFALDNVVLSGGGLSYSNGFETDDGGWALSPFTAGPGGDWSNLVHVNDLPDPLVNCVCNLKDSVLVFNDLSGVTNHDIYQNNFAVSPWIDLKRAGFTGAPEKFVQMDIYADMPLLNYVYLEILAQWYPHTCYGGVDVSPWTLDGVTHYFGGIPTCTTSGSDPFRADLSTIIDSGAEQVRVGIGVFSACLFYPNCTGLTNTSPWVDNVRFGVGGSLGGGSATTPVLSMREIDLPQDSFPQDGTLALDSPGRVDSGTLKGAVEPGPNTELGDTLVVEGAMGGGGAEVRVQFAVRPGPGVNPSALNTFLSRVTFEETKDGVDWYSARMDTAEVGGVPQPGYWMTAYHEEDPGFSGSDTDLDLSDYDPLGGTTRLANDIFPDNVFTPGTRLDLFYKTRFLASSTWFLLPDTTGGNSLEMEVLPSSMDGSAQFNCVLYVDHFDNRGAQELIEPALAAVLTGSSNNAENTAWDRFDVRAPSSGQSTFGQPFGSQYGATLTQALGYKTILWNTGNLDAYTLVDEDANVLKPWLLLSNPGDNRLYLSGDGLATSITNAGGTDPQALDLLENLAGVTLDCGTFNAADCPAGSPTDLTACVAIDPVVGAVVSTRPQGGTPRGQGNGCPMNRSFDVLGVNASAGYGAPQGEEDYTGSSKSASFASVSNESAGLNNFRTVVDGISVHYRRTPEDCQNVSPSTAAVEERLDEVLTWFGYTGSPTPCADSGVQIGVGDNGGLTPPVRTGLAYFSPNPLLSRRAGRIEFSMAQDGPARVDIFDLNGRLVKTVFDGPATAGPHETSWDGTDASGRPVANGVYFYSLRAEGQTFAKKVVVAGN